LRRYTEVPAALRLCLTVGRTPEGADLLQGLGLVGQVADLCAALSQVRRCRLTFQTHVESA
jgi:hypothetical protein